MKNFDPSLYLVVGRDSARDGDVIGAVSRAVAGGVTLVQLREKNLPFAEQIDLARALLRLLEPLGIPLIINDSVDIALAVGAQGVHLGARDEDPKLARSRLGEKAILGVSIESDSHLTAFPWDVIDYAAASPVFSTFSKSDVKHPFGLSGLVELRRHCPRPLVAIGGITLENFSEVLHGGVDGIAVISSILSAEDEKKVARRFKDGIALYRGRRPARVLTIAGSDSGGGAGVQADLKTFEAMGCFGMSAITVLTAQNTETVRSLFPVSPQFVVEQIEAVADDIGIDAIKIGMLYSPAIIEAVAACLQNLGVNKVVLDPVMVAKGGSRLLQEEAIDCLKNRILPLASIVTPNLPEAEVLVGQPVQTREQMERASQRLLEWCPRVVVKGGHLNDPYSAADLYATRDGDRTFFEYARVKTSNSHGTGCTFSAAIASLAAKGCSWIESVSQAKLYLHSTVVYSADVKLGHGCGPLIHGWRHYRPRGTSVRDLSRMSAVC